MMKTDWVGEWFTPVIGERYTIPLTAVNYPELRGKTGVCISFYQSPFGHVWARLEIDGEVIPVRTCYLHGSAVSGEKLKLIELTEAAHTPEEHMARAWMGPSNSGVARLRGPSSV